MGDASQAVMGVPMPATSKFQVVEESRDDRTRLSVRSQYGFGISIDIKPNVQACGTEVDMYALRPHLREKFDRTDKISMAKILDAVLLRDALIHSNIVLVLLP